MKRLFFFFQLSIIAVSVSAVQTISKTQAAGFTSKEDITDSEIQLVDANWTTAQFNALKNATKENTGLVKVDMSQITFIANNTLNASSLFEGCTNLEEVIWFSAQARESAHSFSKAFYGCSKLKGTIDLSAFPVFGSCSNAFEGCASLDTILFSHTATVPTSYTAMFRNMKAEAKVFVPADETWNPPIINSAPTTTITAPTFFRGENKIQVVLNTQAYNNGTAVFTSPEDITESEIQLLNNAAGWTNNQFRALSNATKGNTDLVKVDMSRITALNPQTLNFTSLFEGCTSLERVSWFSIQAGANNHSFSRTFYGCSNLEGTVDLSAIPQFGSCTRTFEGCEKLDAIIFSNTAAFPTSTTDIFRNVDANIKIYISSDESWDPLVNAYPTLTFIRDGKHVANNAPSVAGDEIVVSYSRGKATIQNVESKNILVVDILGRVLYNGVVKADVLEIPAMQRIIVKQKK
jgi:hypothetical protein